MRKILCLIVIALNIFIIRSEAISAQSAILIDAASGRVLYEKNAHQQLPMASTTKIMTGLLACESERGNDVVKVSPFASGTEGSSLWLKIGEEQTLQDLTYGLMLKSGNDAAVAIAEHLGGNSQAFALLMNKRAKKIGALNTSFKNPHGLDDEEHYTTAFDLALISREAMKNQLFRKIVSTKNYTIPMKGENWDRAIKNHNKLLWRYEGCNGVKTGYTKRCGRCLVSSAEKGNEALICVTLNAPDDWNDHTELLSWGFDNYHNSALYTKDEKICTYIYDLQTNKKTPLVAKESFSALICKDDELYTEFEFLELTLPVKKGATVAIAHILCNGNEIGKVDLVTTKDLKEETFLNRILNFIKKRAASPLSRTD